MHRRHFLASSLALVAGGSLLANTSRGTIGLGMQTYTFRNFSLERTLQFLQKLDIHEAEFFSKHIIQTASAEQIAAFLKLCGSYNVKPVAFGVQRFTKKHDDNKKFFDFAKALGVRVASADPEPDSFDSLDKLCEEYKIAVAIHPHGPVGGKMHRWYSADIIMKAVKDHHPLIGSCLDTGHLIRSAQMGHNLDPATEIRIMGKRNFGIHLKDHDNAKKTDVICGKGVLDVKGVFKALREVGFDYSVSLEYEANPENPYDEVAACVKVMKDANT